MYIEGDAHFSDAQAFTSTGDLASTNNAENYVGKDVWGTAKKQNAGEGGGLYLHVRVTTAFTSAAPLTGGLTVKIQESPSTTAASFSDVQTLASGVTRVGLTKGTEIYRGSLPADLDRYIRLLYTTATTVWTAGAIEAFLSTDPSDAKAIYP